MDVALGDTESSPVADTHQEGKVGCWNRGKHGLVGSAKAAVPKIPPQGDDV